MPPPVTPLHVVAGSSESVRVTLARASGEFAKRGILSVPKLRLVKTIEMRKRRKVVKTQRVFAVESLGGFKAAGGGPTKQNYIKGSAFSSAILRIVGLIGSQRSIFRLWSEAR